MDNIKQNNGEIITKVKQTRRAKLSSLPLSPDINPLLHPGMVPIKNKKVQSGLAETTLRDSFGNIAAASVIKQIKQVDQEQFVKVFTAGIAAAYELSKTGYRVFTQLLLEYEATPMTGGFVDTVYLAWFNNGLSGKDIGMSESTFNRGMHELLTKKFIAPCRPNVFWVNPTLFFKGDRVVFINEYIATKKKED